MTPVYMSPTIRYFYAFPYTWYMQEFPVKLKIAQECNSTFRFNMG